MKKIFILLYFIFSFSLYASLDEQFFQNALTYINNRKYYAAIQEMKKAISENSNRIEYSIYLDYLYYVRGENNKARNIAINILNQDETNLFCLLILGDIYYHDKNWNEALEIYNKINSLKPDIKIVNIRLYELLKYTDKDLAHKYYLKALQLKKTDLRVFLPDISKSKINLPNKKNFIIFNNRNENIDKTNDIINLFITSNDISDTESTNIIIQSIKSKKKKKIKISFFRHFENGEVTSKIFISTIIILFHILFSFMKKKRMKKSAGVVLKNYRKNF